MTKSPPYLPLPGKEAIANAPAQSQKQDATWQGNPGSQEKLNKNHVGTSPETVHSALPEKEPQAGGRFSQPQR